MFRFWADKQKFSDLLFGFIKNVQFDDKKNLVISGINQKTVLAEGEKIEKAYFQDKILLVSSHKNQNEDRLIALCSDSTSKFNKETEKENLDETKENIPKDENNLEKFEIFESSDNFTENEKILALSGAPSFRRRIDLAFYCYNSSSLNKKPLFGLSEASLDVFSASKLYFALTEFILFSSHL
ncbi:hypothetical protein MHBO_002294 [Bonamia ostreae]|uniref:Uncharacterized protein n=1 Tax=Bonamia ostreae TaxID=126728 RepID=A0ABV2ALT8_9EUKA